MQVLHTLHGYHARMATWDPNPDLLRTFLEVRRLGSLTRAAEALYLSQPAVTRRLSRLERSLGLPLFERVGKRLDLTEAGETLAHEAQALLGSLDRLAEAIQVRRSGQQGRLRIGASTTPGLYLLPPVILRYQQEQPAVHLQFSIENSLRIEQKIVLNELDLGFVGAHLSHAALRLRPILQDEIVWYASTSHPLLVRRRAVSPRELSKERCLVRETGSATRRLVDTWLRRARVRLGETMLIGCPEAAKVLVRAGVGVSYMSAHGLDGDGGVGLKRLPVTGMSLSRPVFLVLHAQKRISPPMGAFLETVNKILRVREPLGSVP
jgi:DNA-binding transcriptional LysR family regulator